MILIEYYLMPESGYQGTYNRKEGHYFVKQGTIADMIHDSGMLRGYDFDYVIPKFEELNSILQTGSFARLVEWDSITIDEDEYSNIVKKLISTESRKPYRL